MPNRLAESSDLDPVIWNQSGECIGGCFLLMAENAKEAGTSRHGWPTLLFSIPLNFIPRTL
jgi:hypothetical protein